jgi:tRNA-splicing ligase RtcB (3'-phosphate/5'-hydroxy nucleic acid ligase)
MAAAANYGRANRQLLAEAARRAFAATTGARLDLLYDVSHNLAKVEDHWVGGVQRRLCVHRKGATRALPPGHSDLPGDLAPAGQPVLVPGSMGTASYVLAGRPGGGAFRKDVDEVVETCERAGLTRRVARLRPLGVVKG